MAVPYPTPAKVPIYSPTDLKTTTDDHLAPYLSSLPAPYAFTPSHTHSTIRLLLGYSAVIIAGGLFAADYKLGWDVTKPYTLPACVAYFVLNGLLTGYVYFVERGTVFQGTRQGGQLLTLRSKGTKHSGVYELSITYQAPGAEGKVWEEKTVKGEFRRWFGADGYLQRKELAKWLAESIEVVGLAEREREKVGEKKEKKAIVTKASDGLVTDRADDDVIEVDAVTTATPSGKKGKARKKA